jgi:outer membrane protein OmpA-like peptidoglycan-associated protein
MKFVVVLLALLAAPAFADKGGLGTKDPGLYNLKGQIYFLPEGADHMPPDVEKQKSEGVIYSESLDVPERSFTEGFPGVTDRFEWFGIIYTAKFQVKTAGKYHFHSITDDGVRLWIDGKVIMENDSIHGADDANGDVTLKAGVHDLKLWWFQGPRDEIALQFFITPPGGTEKIFSMKDYSGDAGKALSDLGGEATSQGIRVRLDASVLFDVDKSALKSAAQNQLKKLATALAAYPNATVAINGHTSSEGEAAHNQKLSEARAKSVKDALAKLVPKTITLTAAGFGATQPIADNKTEATRAPNRRVEIFVKP